MLWWIGQDLAIVAALVAVVALACRVLRLRPVARHALWLIVLIKLLTPPMVVWPWAVHNPWEQKQALAVSRAPQHQPVYVDEFEPLEASTAVEGPAPAPVRTSKVAPSGPDALTLLLACWVAGAILFSAVQLIRILRMVRYIRRGTGADGALERLVGDLAACVGVRPVRIVCLRQIASPMIFSIFRPVLLWPAALGGDFSEAAVRGLIAHELAHLKRRDHWTGWLELLAGCIWWWNPLYWFARHHLRENAELACDGWVVSTLPQGRRAYAQGLLAICETLSRRAHPLPALGAGTGGRAFLERRLTMILRDQVPLRLPRLGILGMMVLAFCALPAFSQKPPAAQQQPYAETADQTLSTGDGYRRAMFGAYRNVATPDDAQLPPDAREVIQSYAAQQEQARRQYEVQLQKARQELIAHLQTFQDKYTKAGKLDEAVAIRDRIRQLQRGGTGIGMSPRTGAVVQPAPADLTQFRDRVGQSFLFDVTGSADGIVWGSDVYTDDSSLAAAAVHAGILSPGQRGIVRVTILPGQQSYEGSARNGVTSQTYGQWDGSYRVARAILRTGVPRLRPGITLQPASPDPGTVSSYRDRVGQSFIFRVTGSVDGTIWGTDTYTDDSPLATAAVHAGLVAPGQQANIRVTILPGQQSYTGSTRNGVTSLAYHDFGGSYRIELANLAGGRGAARTGLPGMGSSDGPVDDFRPIAPAAGNPAGAPPATEAPKQPLNYNKIEPKDADPHLLRLEGTTEAPADLRVVK